MLIFSYDMRYLYLPMVLLWIRLHIMFIGLKVSRDPNLVTIKLHLPFKDNTLIIKKKFTQLNIKKI